VHGREIFSVIKNHSGKNVLQVNGTSDVSLKRNQGEVVLLLQLFKNPANR